ncbi:penicillin-binding protein [Streptomyces sp. RKND-216]|uniref:transglycosylase domain-containing protein n=1 Tax=Streptomyces sp. RKND-216 TaxID=2562581 RepID=UPI00109DAF79|nr:transglycosylase domain-containing protein [Streptomyces sp. RKND-216]THA26223.1 penicillin-binding protein [Streptomyces sp. RKND-216]
MSDEPNRDTGPYAADGDWTPREEPGGEPDAEHNGSRRTGARRLIPTWRMVVGTVLTVILVISGGMVAGYLLVDIPEPNPHAVSQSNVYLYSDGSRIAVDGDYNRESVPLDEISRGAQHAMLAAEDRNFYSEPAVNLKAMSRAAWNMMTGGSTQSGSTITQQYVKNYYLTQEQTVTRKVKEFFIAIKLDNEVSKDEILQGYLNTSYFGRNAYGIQSAAQAYYGKDADALTIAEGAYLAALVNAPSAYDVKAHPENTDRAETRWRYVLRGMVEEGWLSKQKRKAMDFPEPDPVKPSTSLSGQRGYLVNAVNDHLIDSGIISAGRLRSGGFTIRTTIDREKQDALVDAVDAELVSRLDEENRKVDTYVRTGGTSVDPQTGEVVAMYGGENFVEQYTNTATAREYQVGSTFKPFVFTSALDHDSTTQDGQPVSARTVYDGTSGRPAEVDGRPTDFAPENEDQVDYGPVTVSEAMDKSINAVFAQMGVDVGVENVRETATALGIPDSVIDPKVGASISLGVSPASTVDMAEAYATLANHGMHRDATLVTKVTRGAETVDLPERKEKRVVPRDAADTTTAVLESVVEGGTATAAQSAGRPAAGKTGTAEEDKAAWFAGYTPELATVISVVGKNPETGAQEPMYKALGLRRINGGGPPAEIWGAYTAAALEGEPVKDFDLDTRGPVLPTAPPSEDTDPSGPPATDVPTEEPPTQPTDPGIPTPPTETPDPTGGPSIPPDPTTGGTDGGTTDGGTTDGGTADGGATDGGTTDGPGGEAWGGTSSGYGGGQSTGEVGAGEDGGG